MVYICGLEQYYSFAGDHRNRCLSKTYVTPFRHSSMKQLYCEPQDGYPLQVESLGKAWRRGSYRYGKHLYILDRIPDERDEH